MLPFTTGIGEAPVEPAGPSRSDALSTPYFTEFCSARSLKKASSFRPVTPSEDEMGERMRLGQGGRGGEATMKFVCFH